MRNDWAKKGNSSALVRWTTPSLLVVLGLAAQVTHRELIGGKVFLLLYPPLLMGSLLCGLGPGLIATVLAVVGAWYYFVPLTNSFRFQSPSDVFGVVVFAVTSCIATLLGGRARSSRHKERKSREAVERVKEQLELALEAGGIGTWSWDIKTDEAICDKRTEKILGLEENAKVHFSTILDSIVHDQDRIRVAAELKSTLASGGEFRIEFRIKDGTQRILASHGKLIREKDGTPLKLTGVSWDITQTKSGEARLLASEQRFRSLLDSAPDAIIITDKRGVITLVNRQTERLFGYLREELIGTPVEVLVPAVHRAAHEKLRWEYAQKPTTRPMGAGRDLFAVAKDGRSIPVEVSLSPSTTDGEAAVISVVRDITMRRKNEEQLKIFAAVAETSNDFVGICDPDMKPIFVNESGRAMVGLDTIDEVKRTSVLDYFWPADRPRIEAEAIPALLATGRWSGECRFKNFKTGIPIHTIWNAFLIKNDKGQPVAWATISPNLERLKEAEERLKVSLREKEVLLREIHHRVKNNLNIIASLLDLQGRVFPNSLTREVLIESKNRVSSMALIHEKLYQSENLASIDFQAYVEDLIRCLFESYGVDASSFRPEVRLDSVKLDIDTAIPCSLIINELVSNSLKHGFKGREAGHVAVVMHPVPDGKAAYELDIVDDGIGMPAGFDVTQCKSLGLKLVNTLARQIGGELKLVHPIGGGAGFAIQFRADGQDGRVHA